MISDYMFTSEEASVIRQQEARVEAERKAMLLEDVHASLMRSSLIYTSNGLEC